MNFIDKKLRELEDTFGYTIEELTVIGKAIAESIIASQVDSKVLEEAIEWTESNY